ncbi:MAG: radical SAM protein [Rikenellaceae bacterium]
MLFSDIIIGPIKSRRLGLSLGVNLLPTTSKICNFDCIYCECGWNAENRGQEGFAQADMAIEALEQRLSQMETPPDVITFAGNGEPTLHPHFEQIITSTIELRNKYAPKARVAVLSNATRLCDESVRRALLLVDQNILKLDSVRPQMAALINKPQGCYNIEEVISHMRQFHGKITIQTMLLKGSYRGESVDNTSDEDIALWLDAVESIAPHDVMLYTLDRTPPCSTLERVSFERMEQIAEQVRALGVECSVAK